jgi:ribosomal protein S18 acetylase RimI-like enzyme
VATDRGGLIDEVEAHVRAEDAPRISLTTGSNNPARRLYERHGYEHADEKLDARYERLTGVPGRVLLVKQLGSVTMQPPPVDTG